MWVGRLEPVELLLLCCYLYAGKVPLPVEVDVRDKAATKEAMKAVHDHFGKVGAGAGAGAPLWGGGGG